MKSKVGFIYVIMYLLYIEVCTLFGFLSDVVFVQFKTVLLTYLVETFVIIMTLWCFYRILQRLYNRKEKVHFFMLGLSIIWIGFLIGNYFFNFHVGELTLRVDPELMMKNYSAKSMVLFVSKFLFLLFLALLGMVEMKGKNDQ